MRDSAENVILVGAYVDTQALGTVRVAATWRDQRVIARIRAGLGDVARRGVRLDYERWLGRAPTRAERRALSRELARLEDKGYLIRSGWPWRTTHVRLTDSGRTMAEFILDTPDTEDGPVWAPIQWPDDEEA